VTNSGLAEDVKRVERGGGAPALTLLDLDQLKPINDAHGDRPGDACIVHYAEALGRNLRAGGFSFSASRHAPSLRLSLVSTSAFQLFGFAYCLSLVAGLAVRGGSSSLQTALTKCSVGPLGSRAHQELTPRSLGRSSRMLLCVLSAGPRALGR
jgi:predicted signal transduction protein with EAL and GGDEF domain